MQAAGSERTGWIQGEHARRPSGVATNLRPPLSRTIWLLTTAAALAARAVPKLGQLATELSAEVPAAPLPASDRVHDSADTAGAPSVAQINQRGTQREEDVVKPVLHIATLIRCVCGPPGLHACADMFCNLCYYRAAQQLMPCHLQALVKEVPCACSLW